MRGLTANKNFSGKIKELFKLFAVFFKIGLFSFGGGYAMLTLIESEVVEKRGWLTHSELTDIFAIAESTPGAIAINIATFIGTKRMGILGGIITTLGVVLPSFIIILALSYVIALVKDNRWVGYLFRGIRVGVLVLIAKAVLTFFKDMRKNVFSFLLLIAAFLLAFLTDVNVIFIILGAIVLSSLAVAFTAWKKSRKLAALSGVYLRISHDSTSDSISNSDTEAHDRNADTQNENVELLSEKANVNPVGSDTSLSSEKHDDSADTEDGV